MTYARVPIVVGRSWDELERAQYRLRDHTVRVQDIEWDRDSPTVLFGGQIYNWGGDAFNHLVKDLDLANRDPESEVLLRTVGRTLVAGLTPEYVPVANSTLIRSILHMDLEPKIFRLSPSRSYFLFVNPYSRFNVGGEHYFQGVAIYNSETGYHRFQIKTSLFREVCSNGLTVTALGSEVNLDRLHRQGSLTFSHDLFSSEIRRMLDQTRRLANDFVITKTWLDDSNVVQHWMDTTFGARQKAAIQAGILEAIDNNVPVSRFVLINAVTALHEKFPKTADRWAELGGEMLDIEFFTSRTAPGQISGGTQIIAAPPPLRRRSWIDDILPAPSFPPSSVVPGTWADELPLSVLPVSSSPLDASRVAEEMARYLDEQIMFGTTAPIAQGSEESGYSISQVMGHERVSEARARLSPVTIHSEPALELFDAPPSSEEVIEVPSLQSTVEDLTPPPFPSWEAIRPQDQRF